ncbi:hypothetical protein [Streptomyces sp. H27-C3]|uniref:hypothetical protein n=1 Tax=Streptomyces sp. H27-C3 TaxID=3046305 RepID=UPI0024B98638|nr:hypothetical protein [Streptomyces sp. H27-C3]MDJ0462846.1 hypothetical protein [Streptomyces sp. H27-C3]
MSWPARAGGTGTPRSARRSALASAVWFPPELLPRPWAGAVARELTARRWSLLGGQESADGNAEARPRLFLMYDDVVREAADRAT